jgi:hypothetical protein
VNKGKIKRRSIMNIRSTVLLPAALLMVGTVQAQTTWTGAVDNQINLADNYDNGQPSNTNPGYINGTAATIYTGAAKHNNKIFNFGDTSSLSGDSVNWKNGTVTLNDSSVWTATGIIKMGYGSGACYLNINNSALLNGTKLVVGQDFPGYVSHAGGSVNLTDLDITSGSYDFPAGSTGVLTVEKIGTEFAAAGGFLGLIKRGQITFDGAAATANNFAIDYSDPVYATITVGSGELIQSAPKPFSINDRHMHFTWRDVMPEKEVFMAMFDQIQPHGMTALSPLLLNKNPANFTADEEWVIDELKARGVKVFIGLGKSQTKFPGAGWDFSGDKMINWPVGYLQYTDCIRIDGFEANYWEEGLQAAQDYVSYLVGLGYKHIMINPWPQENGVPIDLPGADSVFVSISLSHSGAPDYAVLPDDGNWTGKSDAFIQNMRAVNPDVDIVTNYESEPQHLALTWVETNNLPYSAGESTNAMAITADHADFDPQNWSWSPPWSQTYDPYALGTWDWIAQRFGNHKTNTYPQQTYDPMPVDGQIDVDAAAGLSWAATHMSTSSDVYFGTDPTPTFVANVIDTTYDPGTLLAGTTYYWQINEVNSLGVTTGAVWSFTVAGQANTAPTFNSNPVSGANATEDVPYTLSVNTIASDADIGDTIFFTDLVGPNWLTINAGDSTMLSGTPLNANSNLNTFSSVTVEDSQGLTATAVLEVFVNSVNDVPTADAQSVAVDEDVALAITLTGSDEESPIASYPVETNPAHGTLSGSAPNLTYTPDADYFGSDSFTFKVNDGAQDSAAATISITVNSVNDLPVADAQAVSVDENSSVAITLTGSDLESSISGYAVVNGPANGALSGTAPNLTYTPDADYFGSDSFTFTVNDGIADSVAATVSITVNEVIAPPSWTTVDYSDFESGWGAIWNDGGTDCRKSSKDAAYAAEGTMCVRLRDDTSSSVMYTSDLSLSGAGELKVSFSYYPRNMNVADEDFFLEISTNSGGNYVSVAEWNYGDEFTTSQVYTDEVVITGVSLTDNTRLRFRCDGPSNTEKVYLDAITVEKK